MKKIANLRVFPTILAGMIVGISFIVLTDMWLPITLVCAAGATAIGGGIALYVRSRKAVLSAALFCVCFVLGLAFGLASAGYAVNDIEKHEIFVDDAEITGKIKAGNSTDLSGKTDTYYIVLTDLTVNAEPVDGDAEFYCPQLKGRDFCEGDVIEFVGSVKTLTTDITTPYKASSLAEGVRYSVEETQSEDYGGAEKTGTDLDFFDKIKKAVAGKLAENAEEGTARFMYAMLFGESAVVNESVRGDFSYTGTAHLLAVSGLHVGMIAGALFLLLNKLKVNIYARNATVSVILVFFCALCGFSSSTVRATLMISISMIAGMCGLRYDALSGMSLAAITLLFVSPFNLYSLGFLMSFTAVYGLILFARPLKNAMTKVRFPNWLASALSATVAANITLLPLLMYVFGEVSLVFALANCIAVPLAGVVFPIYAAALILSFVPGLGVVLTVASLPFSLLVFVVQKLAETGFPSVGFELTWATVLLWLIAATAVSSLCSVPDVAKKIIASVLIICFCIATVIQNAGMLVYENKVSCFASADCVGVLVQSKTEGNYLVFAGTFDEDAAEEALRAVEDSRLRKIDFAVKYSFDEEESVVLDEYRESLGLAEVYAYSSESATATYDLYSLAATASVVCTRYNVEVYLGGVDILIEAEENLLAAGVFDIVVCNYMSRLPEGAEYLVSDYAYAAGENNCLPSDFTFWTDGDRIIKINKWRFA